MIYHDFVLVRLPDLWQVFFSCLCAVLAEKHLKANILSKVANKEANIFLQVNFGVVWKKSTLHGCFSFKAQAFKEMPIYAQAEPRTMTALTFQFSESEHRQQA